MRIACIDKKTKKGGGRCVAVRTVGDSIAVILAETRGRRLYTANQTTVATASSHTISHEPHVVSAASGLATPPTRTSSMIKEHRCLACGGEGSVISTCLRCKGYGNIYLHDIGRVRCNVCEGHGKKKNSCSYCGGKGVFFFVQCVVVGGEFIY